MIYNTTLLEDAIKEIHSHIKIYHPQQLDMLIIADRLKVTVHFQPITSRAYEGEIIIDSRLSPEQQWEDFAHELCHILLQHGNQILSLNNLLIEFLKYQEWKAHNFALHFCVPTFMLQKYEITNISESIPLIKENFNVTYEVAEKRLNHFRNRLLESNSFL
ncbi:ImmA/IrrE family metallo-endopeptidase [Gracilibacillus alcaliphilus]|uniref:ImmA/IrrE family metallo-endopeptidase n=1 Tax=Gracilibacillus alcaliphilus TaxID=1401441 RepID=UPI0019577FDF|nr:ImmA/IrrE family metallo-endopeptidase [Gracilibacillus alcaliphilus]MBM7678914.1 Zn-dependent peptidase ImmA (M78 family) [Gracilibacillus alcaliphilus]